MKTYRWTYCVDTRGVINQLNEWAGKGHDLNNHFVQILPIGNRADITYQIFYDSELDERI